MRKAVFVFAIICAAPVLAQTPVTTSIRTVSQIPGYEAASDADILRLRNCCRFYLAGRESANDYCMEPDILAAIDAGACEVVR